MKNFLYGTITRRVFMRFLEIAVITGLIGLLGSAEFQGLLPPVYAGLFAALVKVLRGYLTRE